MTRLRFMPMIIMHMIMNIHTITNMIMNTRMTTVMNMDMTTAMITSTTILP